QLVATEPDDPATVLDRGDGLVEGHGLLHASRPAAVGLHVGCQAGHAGGDGGRGAVAQHDGPGATSGVAAGQFNLDLLQGPPGQRLGDGPPTVGSLDPGSGEGHQATVGAVGEVVVPA